jgi:hypothetical protein
VDRWDAAARRLAERDRRAPEELAGAVRRSLDYLNVPWPVDGFLNGGVVADLARDALALFLAGGGDAAGLLESVERVPVRDGSPTVGERAARAGTRRAVGYRAGLLTAARAAADDGTGHEHAWPNPYTSCTCGESPPDEPRRRFYPDASRDPAWLDAEHTADD